MTKLSPTKETDAAIIDLVNRKLLKHTVQFFIRDELGKLKPFGSGVLLYTHESHFILTASHVASYVEKDGNNLFIRVKKERYISVTGHAQYTQIEKSSGIDLGYIKIGQETLESLGKPYEFLLIDKVRNHNKRVDGINYCVIGFPENNVTWKNGLMETEANFYLLNAMNEKPYKYYGLNPDEFFIVEMKGEGIDIKNGGSIKVNPHFYGISGCGLWYLMYEIDPHSGEIIIDYRLIGIMIEFKKSKFYCLIANKIHLVINAFRAFEGFQYNEIAAL